MLAKSRLCSTFRASVPKHFDRLLKPHQIVENLIFSIGIWPPFIGLKVDSQNRTVICGPLMGFLLELSSILHSKYVAAMEG